jgi:MFS transporter, CP family, cyanate transporter
LRFPRENFVVTFRSLPTSLVLLWLVGNALRLSILAVPPAIPALRGEFNLSGTEIGILTSLPVVLFAVAALVGSRLVARLGAVRAVVVGLLLTGLGSALRGAAWDVTTLLAATVVMGAGVAVTQPAMPALVGRWLPDRIGFGTGIYTNGLLVGEILPVALFPLLVPFLGGSWRGTFVFWAVPTVAIALLVMAASPREPEPPITVSPRWLPEQRARDIFRMAFVFASASALYFGANAFLPGYLADAGRPDLVSPVLTALNLGQLPASLFLIGFARQLEARAWPFVAAGLVSILCIVGIATTASAVTVACAAMLGFSAGGAFALGLTLPPLLSAPNEVARVSGAMFTISYASTVVISVLSGAVWDLTGAARVAFLPIALAAVPSIVLVLTLRFDRKTNVGGDSPAASRTSG